MGTITFRLLVQQYDAYFMMFILIWLAVYILAAIVASRVNTNKKWLMLVLSIGTGVLIIAPLLYRLALRVFILVQYGW